MKLFACLITMGLLAVGCTSSAGEKILAEKNGKTELARQFLDSNQLDKAVSILQSLTRQFPEDSTVHYLYGLALLGRKDVEAAKLRFEKSLELDGNNDDARLSLGYTLIALKNFKEAKKQLEIILNRDSYLYIERVYVNLGLVELEQNQCTAALEYFDKATEQDPTLVSAYFNKGKCLVKLGKLKLALEALEKAMSFCPGCGEPQLEFALVEYKMGLRSEALAHLRELIERSEDAETRRRAQSALGRLEKEQPRKKDKKIVSKTHGRSK